MLSGGADGSKPARVYIDKEEFLGPHGSLWNRREKRIWSSSLFAGCAILYSARTVMPLCMVKMAEELEWTKSQSGTVLSAFFWGYTMTQIIGGYTSDRIGGDIVITLAAIGWSLITFWTPRLAYFYQDKSSVLVIIVISRVALGACQGFHYPSFTSILSRKVAETERTFTMTFVCAGAHAGTLFCGSVGSLLLDWYSWHCPFYFIGILGVAWLLFIRYYLIARQRQRTIILSVKDELAVGDKHPSLKEKNSVPWLVLFTTPAFWAMICAHFSHANSFFILLSWLPSYFHENFPDANGWVFNVVPWLVTIPTSILSGYVSDILISKGYSVTFVRKLMETISQLGTALALVVISYTNSYTGALTCMALAVALSSVHNSGGLVNPQDIAPRHAGSVFGLMNMCGAIPGFIGVYIAGHILEATKSWSAVFNQTAAVCVAGWSVFALLGTGQKIV